MVDFDPAIMNPASIILPTAAIDNLLNEHLSNTDAINYIDIIIIVIFILLIVMIYLRTTHKI